MIRIVQRASLLIFALAVSACAEPTPVSGIDPLSPGDPAGAEDVTEVQIALTSVPAGVQCVKIVATIGNQNVTPPLLTVAANASTASLSLGQLPLGAATFNGFAYNVGCASVTNATTASWIADPATAALSAGIVAVVPLTFRKNNPVTVSANFLDNVAGFSVGNGATLALMTDGTVRGVSGLVFPAPTGLTNVVQVSSGIVSGCARKSDGTVWCWGINSNGLIPTAPISNNYSTTPVQIGLPGPATDLAVGGYHACAIVAKSVYCWGADSQGQSGLFSLIANAPVTNVGGPQIGRIFAGDYHTCGISTGGALYCWGWNYYGQVGTGTSGIEGTGPTFVPSLTFVNVNNVLEVAMGSLHTCALRGNGTVACWGAGNLGQLGNGTFAPQSATPVAVSGLTDATQIAAGAQNTCVRRMNGQVSCWGVASTLGTGAADHAAVTVPVLGNALAVRAGHGWTTCAELADRTAKCWGDNTTGQIGDGTFMFAVLPTFVKLQ